MSLIDWLKNIFSNKKRSILTSTDLAKIKGETTPLEAILTDKEDQPLSNETIYITINNKTYERTTNEQGIATININLNPGMYKALIRYNGNDTYNGSTAYSDINISAILEAEDLNMIQGDGSKFSVTTKDSNGEILPNTKVNFTINNKGYDKVSDENGVAGLTINLNAGNYKIISCSVLKCITNNINIQPAPAPAPEPECKNPYEHILNMDSGCGTFTYSQRTGYYCGCNALQCCFYKLTGVELPESTIAGWAGTTSSGTGHAGLNTAVAKFNQTYGTKLEIEWKNLSELGWDKLGCIMSQKNTAVFTHCLYRNKYGHYEVPRVINTQNKTIEVYNSLGSYCSNGGYVGYLETRSLSTEKDYLRGISQPSIAIIRDKS